MLRCLLIVIGLSAVTQAFAQGEDSLPSERDMAVIATLLPGIYDNNNQTYFERRTKLDEALHHQRLRIDVGGPKRYDAPFDIVLSTPGVDADTTRLVGQLKHNAAQGTVEMSLKIRRGATCRYVWQREPQQFRARQINACEDPLPKEMVLGQQQLWIYPQDGAGGAAVAPSQLHRAREFECYADMPGVGGGRDIPYERYDKIKLHDRGATHWITTRDEPPREIGITLWQVDWPINNYDGVFTRDSLVIYVSEKTGDESVEHGYAFVEPDARRVGINLKWLLATCFMESNSVTRPSM